MAQCNDITQCIDIVECTTTLVLFETPQYVADPYIYIKNLCNDHTLRYEPVVGYGGKLEIELNQVLSPECRYIVWVNDELNISFKRENFEMEGITVNALEFGVSKLYDSDYNPEYGFTSELYLE